MKELVEFLSDEMPHHAKELQSDIGLLIGSMENTQSAIEGTMSTIERGNYAKIGKYYSMARKMGNLMEQLTEIQQYFGIENSILPQEDEEELIELPDIEKKNYESCKVDETIAHGLFENYTHKRPSAFTLEGNKYSIKDWKQMLRIVCEILNQKNAKLFESFINDNDMQGSTRIYFSYSNSHMYDGRRISGSNVYVETNHNANAICSMISNMLGKYDIPVTAIQIYLRSDYTPLHKKDNDSVKKVELQDDADEAEYKIGKLAKEYFSKYFSDLEKEYDITNFLNKYWCNEHLGICYPLLKEVDISIPITQQKNYNNEYARYWTKPILNINGKHYILCSQWFKSFQEKLDKWISEESNNEQPFKTDVYVVPKKDSKICPTCQTRLEKEMLFVTYHTEIADIENRLFTRRCPFCEKTFIADTIFKTYTQSKNLEDINVNFIK